MGKFSGSRRNKTGVVVDHPKRDLLSLFTVAVAVGLMVGMVLLMGRYQHDTEVEESYKKGRQSVIDNMYQSSGLCNPIKLNGKYGVVEWIPERCCK